MPNQSKAITINELLAAEDRDSELWSFIERPADVEQRQEMLLRWRRIQRAVYREGGWLAAIRSYGQRLRPERALALEN